MALALITDFSRYLKPPPLGGESIHFIGLSFEILAYFYILIENYIN